MTVRWLLLAPAMLLLAGCAGLETGKEAGIGIDTLDTETKAEKDETKWFTDFYGSKHCVWGSGCSASEGSSDSDGSTSALHGGVGPTDASQ